MARGMEGAQALAMHAALRILLWMVAIVAPGGFLLLPLLVAEALKKKLPTRRDSGRAVQA
jgi:hypothetical protein